MAPASAASNLARLREILTEGWAAGGTPPIFSDVWQAKDLQTTNFGCVARKGVKGAFSVGVARGNLGPEAWVATGRASKMLALPLRMFSTGLRRQGRFADILLDI